MLNVSKMNSRHGDFVLEEEAPQQFGIRWMIGAIIRFKILILSITLVALLLALAFVLFRPATFTATSHLQLTNLRLTFSRDDAFFAETQLDPTFIETQIQIMRSERIALAVVDNLKLADQPIQTQSSGLYGLLGELATVFNRPAPDAGVSGAMSDGRAAALKLVQRGMSAERVALSNVVELRFTAQDAEQAARITNDLVRAYIVDQNMARIDAAQAGSSWLRERLREVGPKTRVIAAAMPPADKSNFRGILILAIAGILGGAVSVTAALILAFIDGRIRTPEQLIAATQAPFLGVIPANNTLSSGITINQNKDLVLKGRFQLPYAMLDIVQAGKLTELWHTLKNIKFAADEHARDRRFCAIGITSLINGEGSTTVASHLAVSLAASGQRTLLVDANTYAGDLSKRFGLAEERGLFEDGTGRQSDLNKLVKIEQDCNLHVMPLGTMRAVNTFDWSNKLSLLIANSRENFDYVVFDLPPLTMSGDLRAAARYADGFVLVSGWGRVSVEQMQVGLSMVQPVQSKLIGCVLNRIDLPKMRLAPSKELDFIRLRKKSS